jgi:predicted unusual protein kinase regulating ubiquinone biosynthesis (AarF/ABC1/UbiB family)
VAFYIVVRYSRGMWNHLIPDKYKFLLDFVSPFVFKVIDIKEALLKLSQFNKGLDNHEYKEAMTKWLPELLILDKDPSAPLDQKDAQGFGEAILRLYFTQFQLKGPMSLDLRLARFSNLDNTLAYYPQNFCFHFDARFLSGLSRIYQGFYNQDQALMEEGMLRAKLCPEDANTKLRQKCLAQIQKHFGHNLGEHSFSLEQFKDSFHQLFCHLKEHNIRIQSDFLFLGIYLFTLYSSLEQTKRSYNVQNLYLNLFKKTNTDSHF